MNPIVSIVFTSYNHRPYLKQAIDSLLSQTFKDFELIIVDDCSTDGSQDVLKTYNDPRIRLFLKDTNSGSYVKSTNYGASYALAPYILFAQCDDWAESTQLEKLVAKMRSNDVGVVFSCSNMVDDKGALLGTDFDVREYKFRCNYNKDSIIKREEVRHYLYYSCIIPNLSAALIKKELYEELGSLSTDYLVLADWDFWLRMTRLCDFYYIREPLNNFRQHSTTIRSRIKIKRQVCEVFNMVFSFFEFSGKSKFEASHVAANLWFRWASASYLSWIKSFPELLLEGMKYTLYFPIAAVVEFIKVVSLKLFRRNC